MRPCLLLLPLLAGCSRPQPESDLCSEHARSALCPYGERRIWNARRRCRIRVCTEEPTALLEARRRARYAKHDIQTWPRAGAASFGCFLEKTFGARDPRFNCALGAYENHGDPCHDTAAYYEGPAFPAGKAGAVHPLAREIRLAWEHGDLQAVHLTLRGRLTEEEALRALRLPPAGRLLPHVSRISVQACAKEATCVLVEGFDHMGAGEVECGESPRGK